MVWILDIMHYQDTNKDAFAWYQATDQWEVKCTLAVHAQALYKHCYNRAVG